MNSMLKNQTVVLTYLMVVALLSTNTELFGDDERLGRIVSAGTPRAFVSKIQINHRVYAQHRNFSYEYYEASLFTNTLAHLRPHWVKVLVLESELNSKQLSEGSWLIWVDDDVFFTDFEKYDRSIFERYIDAYASPETCLIATEDCDDSILLNSGVLMFRVGDCAREIVRQWWDLRPREGNCHHDDQAKLIELVERLPEWQTVIVPQRVKGMSLNTFLAGDTSKSCFARKEDYVSQPAGASESDKNRRLIQLLDHQRETYADLYSRALKQDEE